METALNVRTVPSTLVRGSYVSQSDFLEVPVESPLALELNGSIVARLMRLPGHDAELALGYCFTEGWIRDLGEVATVEVCAEQGGSVRIRTTTPVPSRPVSLLLSACGGGGVTDDAQLPEAVGADDWTVEAELLSNAMARMLAAQVVYRQARAVHGAAFFSRKGDLIVVREDVGRHNAMDKAVGYCLYHKRPMDGILATTGRASSEMVLKAAVTRTPILLSRSGPTSLGIELAQRLAITLICYARGPRMSVLTHAHRVRATSY